MHRFAKLSVALSMFLLTPPCLSKEDPASSQEAQQGTLVPQEITVKLTQDKPTTSGLSLSAYVSIGAALITGLFTVLVVVLKNRSATDILHIQHAMQRIESLEAGLKKSRGESYGEIWQLTGELNLFGEEEGVNGRVFSERLKNWYFEHGWILSQPSKDRYFLVQEILNFGRVHALSYARPSDAALYSTENRTIEELKNIRADLDIKWPCKDTIMPICEPIP